MNGACSDQDYDYYFLSLVPQSLTGCHLSTRPCRRRLPACSLHTKPFLRSPDWAGPLHTLALHSSFLLPSTFHDELIIWVECCPPDEESRGTGTVIISFIVVALVPGTGRGTVKILVIACGKNEWVNEWVEG